MWGAVVQLSSNDDAERNLSRAAHWIGHAASAGAELVALPENFPYLRREDAERNPLAQDLDGPIVAFLREQAKLHGVVLAGGTLPEAIPNDERVYNTSVVVDRDGAVRGVYRKIHLFDVSLSDVGLQESKTVAAGAEIVVAETRAGVLGLSICYDLRFPELYRALTSRGAQVLLVPSAFTVPTGRDHWEILLRARAIENQAYVLAAAQYGVHSETRRSYGRSMIVDPWGTVLATVPDGEGFAVAELDFERLERLRRELPALLNRRLDV